MGMQLFAFGACSNPLITRRELCVDAPPLLLLPAAAGGHPFRSLEGRGVGAPPAPHSIVSEGRWGESVDIFTQEIRSSNGALLTASNIALGLCEVMDGVAINARRREVASSRPDNPPSGVFG